MTHSSNGTGPAGFVAAERWRWVEATPEELPPAEGSPPFRAEIKVNLTGGELLPLLRGAIPYERLVELLAPLVRDWNLTAEVERVEQDGTTVRAREAVPPPAAGGPGSLLLASLDAIEWLWRRVRDARFEAPDRPNSGTPAGGSAGGRSGISVTEDEGTLTTA